MPTVDSPLAAPIEVGPVRLRNRLVATAHASGLVREGLAQPGDAEYWGRVADGGAAMLISGGTVTAPESTPRRRRRGGGAPPARRGAGRRCRGWLAGPTRSTREAASPSASSCTSAARRS